MEILKRPSARFVWSPPNGAPIVSMILSEGRILLATRDTLYEVKREWPSWVISALQFLRLR